MIYAIKMAELRRRTVGRGQVKIWLHMIKFPVRDADGKVSGLGAIATDATQRKRAETALT